VALSRENLPRQLGPDLTRPRPTWKLDCCHVEFTPRHTACMPRGATCFFLRGTCLAGSSARRPASTERGSGRLARFLPDSAARPGSSLQSGGNSNCPTCEIDPSLNSHPDLPLLRPAVKAGTSIGPLTGDQAVPLFRQQKLYPIGSLPWWQAKSVTRWNARLASPLFRCNFRGVLWGWTTLDWRLELSCAEVPGQEPGRATLEPWNILTISCGATGH